MYRNGSSASFGDSDEEVELYTIMTRRHHFIPVFYLKHFTNDQGKFYIYETATQQFKGGGRLFSPKQQFFEWGANTVTFGADTSDFIEHSYSDHDTKVAAILDKIAAPSGQSSELSTEEWTYLQYFINILYWRNPGNEAAIAQRIREATSPKDLYLKVVDKNGGERLPEAEQLRFLRRMQSEPEFRKYFRSMLPAVTYPEIFAKNKDYAHIFNFPSGLPKLVSDYPIIYGNPGKVSLHTDELIFPLTPTKILFRNAYKGLLVHSVARILIDMLLVMQAKSYVSCTDQKYPLRLQEEYHRRFSSIEQLRERIFMYVFDSADAEYAKKVTGSDVVVG